MGQPQKISRPILIAMIVVVVAVLLGLLFPATSSPEAGQSPKAGAKTQVMGATAALKAYFTEYNEPLTGSNAQVMTVLRGQNARKIIFFDTRPQGYNSQGELIDPWGTPYRFDLSKSEAPRVWSCGPNRKDEGGAEGSDDIVSWR
jgi:hypothetical protein